MTLAEREVQELKAQLVAVLHLSNQVNQAQSPMGRRMALAQLHGSIQATGDLIRTYAADLMVEG